MKRTWLLAALFVALGVAAYFAFQKKQQKASTVAWDMDFAVKNVEDIGKIFIADRDGQTATLERMDGYWRYNGKWKARPTAVGLLAETLSNIRVQYIPPKSAVDGMVNTLASIGLTVEVYDKSGERMKRYVVGGVTNDEKGTYMIMDGSNQPYVVQLPSFVGQVRVRYLLGDDNWRDRTIFEEKPSEIQSLTVDYPNDKFESFKLEQTPSAEFSVSPLHSHTPVISRPQRKGVPEGYVLQFEKVGAEAFETENPLRDSICALVPFATVTLKKTDGSEKWVRFFPVEMETNTNTGAQYVRRYFAQTSGGDFMLTQDRVFGPIFRGYGFFFEKGKY